MPARGKKDAFRRALLATPFPKEWDAWLSANMGHYPLLPPERPLHPADHSLSNVELMNSLLT